MAQKKTLYPATIKRGEEFVMVDVDVFDLPYGEFDARNPLLIAGGINLGKPRGRAFPNFENVVIDGVFDCSDFPIESDTVLPRGITTLICNYSIADLKVLIGKLPYSVSVIVTRPAILNNVKRKDADAVAAAREFMMFYPNVIVTDTKQGLLEILQGLEAPQKSATSKPSRSVVVDTPSVPVQTAEWLSDKEVCVVCKQKSEIINALSDEDVLRYIKQARSAKARLNIRNQKMHRASDKCEISCIHQDSVDTVMDYIVAQAKADKERALNDIKKRNGQPPKKQTENVKAANTNGADTKLKTKRIRKYILRSVWKDIQSACGKNTTLLRQILTDINDVNLVPDISDGGAVFYVQDNTKKRSASLECKSATCVCQGFESRKSAQRIVWGVAGTKLIAQYFFAAHDGEKTRMEYKEAINNIDVEKEFSKNPEKYLSVSDLLSQMGERGENKIDAEPVKPAKSIVKKAQSITQAVKSITETVVPKSEPAVAPAVTPVAPVVVAQENKAAEPVVKRRKRTSLKRYEKVLHRGDTNAQIVAVSCTKDEDGEQVVTAMPVNPINETVSVAKPEPETTVFEMPVPEETKQPAAHDIKPEWVDICSVHTEYTIRLGKIKTQIADLLVYMNQENDVSEMMRVNQEIGSLLQEREKCELALKEIHQINSKLVSLLSKVVQHG